MGDQQLSTLPMLDVSQDRQTGTDKYQISFSSVCKPPLGAFGSPNVHIVQIRKTAHKNGPSFNAT